jgi:nicotinate dehydrogenase subunit A
MIELTVNGQQHAVDAEPDTPLLYVLRGLGQCGACTVIVDGAAVFSCITPIAMLPGRVITTIEGLGAPDHPGPLQQAFIQEQAAQCGYCIAGMVMRAHAMLARTPNPTEQQIRDGMNPNLCRCGTHMRILAAVRRAAGTQRADAR